MSQHPLARLKRYDIESITRYYRFRPWLVFARAVLIVWKFAGFLLGLRADRGHTNPIRRRQRAVQLRHILTDLGPTYIKVGQALSTRPDLVHKDFLEELTRLQDQLPPFPNDIAFAIIEQELERSVSEVYQTISADPVAAASLGQVYKATLHTGEEVAVKVQRPNLLPTLTLDLHLMRWAASWLGPHLPLNLGHDLLLIVDEFGTKLFEEIDYLNEGRNAERFAAYFKGDVSVKVPSIYWRHSSRHVLTLEWINGIKLTDVERVQAAGLDISELVRIGVSSGLRQLLEFGFFHADPHPGNLFATLDGKMAYIDFGMMDQLEQHDKEILIDAVVYAVNKDYDHLTQAFVELGFLAAGTDIQPIVPAIESVLGNVMGESVADFNIKTVTDKFSELMFEYPFRVPGRFALIIRSVVTQEGVALSLDPNFRILEVAYPYVARRLLSDESPELRRRLLEVLFKDGRFQWQRLENLIQIAQIDAGFDLMPTAQLGLQYLLSEEGQFLRRKLLLALTEDDRLHTDEVRRIWNLVKGEIKPDRLWGAALGALATVWPSATALVTAFTPSEQL
ncbi:AarF/ABC1/UbiB kinase family protein [Leptolyngbya sp. FACHB-261]|uniref:ABC1 kinase family protein n=1 Tax=Leptolyngbya sp. FACHB-261 TaxID=2692806 RepID=UPI001688EBAA|nr:AarF/UbiB family protein [Leptolyngbya sp. FACHB-261]MBD2100621.1 AarF/ABC1/UbiB kinase family protein [Leptolyngbya sp. FACHB-261]